MVFERLLPKKFSSRLFLMTLVAGLIPVVIFAVLINIYGKEIEKDITRVIEEGYKQSMYHSGIILREMGEASMYNRVIETAEQLDLVIQSVPWMTLSDLQKDRKFRDLAVQSIGETGYTFLFEWDTAVVRFHRDSRLEDKDLRRISSDVPDFLSILRASLKGPSPARGYYGLRSGDGNTMQRFLCIVPLHSLTADGVRLMIAGTVNAEDFSSRIKESQTIHSATKRYVTAASNMAIQSFRHKGFLLMGLGILTVSLLAFVMGIYSSRAVSRLREATARVNRGDFSTPVKVSGSGEVATLIQDFNTMVDQLATTTVSKQLLQASESRLKVANSDLRREITERERTEEALAAEKERLNVTLRSIGDGVITADRDGRILLINKAAEELTGFGQEEATGLDLSRVFQTAGEVPFYPSGNYERPRTDQLDLKNALNRKTFVGRDGTERVIAETKSPIYDQSGAVLGTVIVFRDISDQQRIEEELLKVRKLESVAVLAGGIAHDFNNLLAVILGNVSFAKMFMKPQDKGFNRLVEAEESCMRGKDLTYQLLTFARGGEPLRRVMNIAPLIEEAVKSSLAESRVAPLLSIPDKLFPVEIDEEQIRQVIKRMVDNADEAMENEGSLMVGAENVSIDAASHLGLKQGDYVRILVQDEGPGIPEEDLERIFDPYFTRKQMGYQKGTGLGLSICYSVVKDHGGLITVESEPGKGTLFQIYLPAAESEEEQPAQSEELSFACDAPVKGKLLFMDDDEGVRDVIVEMLAHLGYNVQFAKDGLEAIEQYTRAAKSGEPFDVVIADLTVRDGMGGKDLVKELHQLDPWVRAVISSGFSNDPVLHDFKKYGFLGVVSKPYKIEDLCAVVNSVMQDVRVSG